MANSGSRQRPGAKGGDNRLELAADVEHNAVWLPAPAPAATLARSRRKSAPRCPARAGCGRSRPAASRRAPRPGAPVRPCPFRRTSTSRAATSNTGDTRPWQLGTAISTSPAMPDSCQHPIGGANGRESLLKSSPATKSGSRRVGWNRCKMRPVEVLGYRILRRRPAGVDMSAAARRRLDRKIRDRKTRHPPHCPVFNLPVASVSTS